MKGVLERQRKRKKSCDEVDTIRELTYLGDRVSDMEDVRLLQMPEQDVGGLSSGSVVSCCMVRRFPLKLKGAVYNTVWK